MGEESTSELVQHVQKQVEAESAKFMQKCFKWEIMYMYEDAKMRKLRNPIPVTPKESPTPSMSDLKQVLSVKDIQMDLGCAGIT